MTSDVVLAVTHIVRGLQVEILIDISAPEMIPEVVGQETTGRTITAVRARTKTIAELSMTTIAGPHEATKVAVEDRQAWKIVEGSHHT